MEIISSQRLEHIVLSPKNAQPNVTAISHTETIKKSCPRLPFVNLSELP